MIEGKHGDYGSMNYLQVCMIDAARNAIFAQACELHKSVYDRKDVVESMSDLMDQLDHFVKAYQNKSGIPDRGVDAD